MVLERYGLPVVFLGEHSEASALRSIASRLQENKRVSVFPSDDLLLSAVLLEKATLFVGSDSGPLHLAALLGTPVVGLFGPSTPALTAPVVPHGAFLYDAVPCSPCAQTTCVQPEDHCMQRLTPEAVLAAIDQLLQTPQAHRMATHAK